VDRAVGCVAGAACALLYDADNGLRAVFNVNAELEHADERVAVLWSERIELVERAERLRTDPFEIESVARESLGMVRPGEIVVRLRGAPQAMPQARASYRAWAGCPRDHRRSVVGCPRDHRNFHEDEVDKLLRAAAARLLEKHAPHALDLVSNSPWFRPRHPSTVTSRATRRS